MAETKEVRDVFNPNSVTDLANRITGVYPAFNKKQFVAEILAPLAQQTYSQRIENICDALYKYLPKQFEESAPILVKALPNGTNNMGEFRFESFIIIPLTRYVGRYGLNHFNLSMQAFFEMTQHMTAEWDIRHFLVQQPEKTLQQLHTWSSNNNFHVRRLVSEGTRPRLPWGMRLHQFVKNPQPVMELLEKLKADPELYVRRSVANNLNDIAKDHPKLVVDTLKRWQKDNNAGTDWIIKHATRSLIKMGYTDALSLLGFNPDVKLSVSEVQLSTAKLNMGDSFEFSFELSLEGKSAEDIVVDYVIYFVKANGKLAPKVFKLKQLKLAAGEKLRISKKHSIKPITTRKYYAGNHQIAIQVNGKEYAPANFHLNM